jgi:ubiquinol-cytochrome c reductase cytochrome c subunit
MKRIFMISLFTASSAFAQDQAPSGSVEAGYKAFMKYQCYTCHGTIGQGGDRGTGPKLAPNPFPWAGFEHQVRTPRQDMPAYRKQHVSDQELADIYAYVRSIKPSPDVKSIPLLKFE